MKKKVLIFLLALVMALSLAPLEAHAAGATVASGKCGANGGNVTWKLDSSGTLTISGTGKMADYSYYQAGASAAPWNSYDIELKAVTIGKGVTSIGSEAFRLYGSLTSVTIPNSVTSIGDGAFFDCDGLTSITIPGSVTSIGENAFSGCSSLTSVAIPGSVTSIGEWAFNGCSGLSSVTIGNSVTSIGDYAFCGCSGLSSVTIPDSVASIGDYAFSDCSGLINVMIGNGVTSIGSGAFYHCSSLTGISVADSNPNYMSKDGVLFNKNGKTLIVYPGAKTGVYQIPDSVTSITLEAFNGCSGLTSVTIPDGVTSLEMFTFSDCIGLTSVTIPGSVTSIGYYVFSGCSSLADVYFNGTKTQWDNIAVSDGNDPLQNAVIHYQIGAPVAKPSYVSASGKPYVYWSAVAGASKYEVYRATSKTGTYSRIGTTTKLNFTDSTAQTGTTYFYKVRAVSADGSVKSGYSTPVTITCRLARPVVKTATNTSGKPRLTWSAVAGASKYEVYRSTSENGTYSKVFTTTGTSYTNTSAKAGTTYYYKVKAISNTNSAANSAYSVVSSVTCRLAQPVVKIATNTSGKPRLTWSAVAGASKYEVYRSTSENGTYSKVFTTTGTSYTNTSAKAGSTYYYKVKAISNTNSAANSAYSVVSSVTCRLAQPVVKIATNTSGKPRLTWSAVAGASKYEVYRSTSENGTYTRAFTTTGTSFTNTSAKAGTTYYYKVKAISSTNSAANSAYSAVRSIKAK